MRNAQDFAVVARGQEQGVILAERHGPNIGLSRAAIDLGLTFGIETVNASVGGCRGVEPSFVVEGERVHHHLVGGEQDREFAFGVEFIDLALVAGPEEHGALRVLDGGPDNRIGQGGHVGHGRRQLQMAVAGERDIVKFARAEPGEGVVIHFVGFHRARGRENTRRQQHRTHEQNRRELFHSILTGSVFCPLNVPSTGKFVSQSVILFSNAF